MDANLLHTKESESASRVVLFRGFIDEKGFGFNNLPSVDLQLFVMVVMMANHDDRHPQALDRQAGPKEGMRGVIS